ncbi:chorismate mutase [Phenylobacterium sp.]|uniref:chorismate mutase n=1 Tax=Phenylobacterium sp. TaxID=1871053 RepID=UPI00273721F1|nr:chorismate mutase [Phenylobacterium sp.]MDP3658811.1 chorismate mutase [Phenylobacterium sp.]
MAEADPKTTAAPSLDAVRTRIDAIDAEVLRLVDERAGLAHVVVAAKAAAGDAGKFGLRPARETQIIRRMLSMLSQGATPGLVIRIWREMMAESLALQGPFNLSVWGGADATRTVELARARFGGAPGLKLATRPEEALAAALSQGGVGVLALNPDTAWWGRLLAQPRVKVFAALPCLSSQGPMGALAVAEVEVEPTGSDMTFWVTDAAGGAGSIEEALGRDGVAATCIAVAGGLKLFSLAGFYQADDARLARAPGGMSGVIGAAPTPFDV